MPRAKSKTSYRVINHSRAPIILEPPLSERERTGKANIPASSRRVRDAIRLLPFKLGPKDEEKVNEVDVEAWDRVMNSYPVPGSGTTNGKPTMGPPPVLAAYLAKGRNGGITVS